MKYILYPKYIHICGHVNLICIFPVDIWNNNPKMYLKMTYVGFFFIKSLCPHVFMLFIINSINVNMFDIVTKYDLRQPWKSLPPRRWDHLTHWGRVTHICVSNLTIISSVNGLSPGRYQAIIWTNAGILLLDPDEQTTVKSSSIFKHFHSRKCVWKCHLGNGGHFVPASLCVNVNYINM